MAAHPEVLLRHLRALVPDPFAERPADAELLDRFARANDEDAFATLVARHGPMVHGVCRRALRDAGAAEDVAQAAFLVLARKAKSIRRPESLPAWLHRTARLLSLKYRQADARRRKRETQSLLLAPARTSTDPLDELTVRELLEIFDEELQRLLERYRVPLILCCLEGRSQEEAARQLGWSTGSVKGRLERGRERLHDQLVRRGLSLSAALVSLEAVRGGTSAADFVSATTRAALLFASGTGGMDGGVTLEVAAMAEEGIRSTAMSRVMIALSLLLAVGMVGAGVMAATYLKSTEKPLVAEQTAAPEQPRARTDLQGDPLPKDALARLGTIRWRTERTDALAYAPDGKTLAAAGGREICLFDTEGKITKRIRPGDKTFDRVAFSPDGKRLACRCNEINIIAGRRMGDARTVQVWELQPVRKVQEFKAVDLQWLGWSVAGEPVGVVLVKGAVLFRELAMGKERRLECRDVGNPGFWFCSCTYAPTARLLAVSDQRAVIHVWDVSTGKKRWTLETKSDGVSSLAFSPDGRRLASLAHSNIGSKYVVQLWDLTTGKPSANLAGDQDIPHVVAFAPDGKTLATAGWTEVRFYDTTTLRERSRTRGPAKQATIAFSPDSKTLASVDVRSPTIQRWEVQTGALKPTPTGHVNPPHGIAFSPDGNQVATGSGEGSLFIWRPTTGELQARVHDDGGGWACAFSGDGRSLYSCTRGDTLTFYDASTGRVLNKLKLTDPDRPDAKQSGLELHLSTDRKTLVALSMADQGYVMLITSWDPATHKQLFRRRRTFPLMWPIISPDTKMLAAVAGDGREAVGRGSVTRPVWVEDLASGEHLLTLPPVGRQTWPVSFSADGRLLATIALGEGLNRRVGAAPGKNDQILLVWDLETAGEVLALPIGPEGQVAFSPDHRLLALFGPNTGEIVVWDLRRGQERQRFSGLGAFGSSLAFSPDSQLLVSGLANSTLLVWKVATQPKAGRPAVLDAAGTAKAWAGLAGDPRKAFAARGALEMSPEKALPLLKKRLKPVQPADPALMRRLLADLDSDNFKAREKARKELEELGDRASGALCEALKKRPSLEAQRRIEALLKRLMPPIADSETLRSLRAIAVLEDIGTSEARKILETLAKGSMDARLTREAKATLERMATRSARGSSRVVP